MKHSIALDPPSPPAWMPQKVAEARRFAHYAGLAFLFAAAVHGLLFVASVVQNIAWFDPGWILNPGALLHLIAILGCFSGFGLVRTWVIATLDAGVAPRARSNVLRLGILALVFFIFGATLAIIPAILLAIAWVNLEPAPATSLEPPRSSSGAPPPPEQYPLQ